MCGEGCTGGWSNSEGASGWRGGQCADILDRIAVWKGDVLLNHHMVYISIEVALLEVPSQRLKGFKRVV